MRELKTALKSRPMRRLRDLQKRRYDISPLLLGVHGVRMELGNRTGTALELLEMEPLNDDTKSRTVCHLISCSLPKISSRIQLLL